ncbi:ABC transporter ATP-binding protein [Nonomuraea sp. NPDC059007]|uniref:ABC transporter ATP-binding protein n=1 Tax=Nonomuraea sp. NPDC059007 TaxID=3346692 RepID=UPI00368108A3
MRKRWALWTLLWRALRWHLPIVGVLAVAQGTLPVAAILASGLLIDSIPAAPGRALTGLVLLGAASLASAGLSAMLDCYTQVLDGRYAETLHRTVAQATLDTPGIAVLEDPGVAGELAALEEFERVDGHLGTVGNLRALVTQRITGAGALVVLFTFAWWAPLVMLVGWRALSHGIGRWFEHGMALGSTIGAEQMGRARYLRGLAVEPHAAKEIRVFGLGGWLVEAYAETYMNALRAIWRGRKLGMRTILAATGVVTASHALVLGMLGWQAAAGIVSVAQVVVFVQAVLGSSAQGYLFGVEVPLARARQVAWQTLRLARRTAAAPRPRGQLPPGPLEVRLTGVRFTYPAGDKPTLDGLDLRIPAGQSLAIVGENGAGKSTLIKLLCGLYEPDIGRVRVGDEEPVSARHRIGVIFQNFTRYELPLRANVEFGSLGGGAEVVARALSDAGADELAQALPSREETVLSARYPGGQDLSGGQWQKVALARALAAVHGGAGLLILDEPTSSLDVRAETELFERFMEFTEDVTTILVSHRLASVRHADRIVVVAGGRVVEDGTHEELMAANGRYAAMFALQASRFNLEGAGHD